MAYPLTSDNFNLPYNTLKNIDGQAVVMFYRPNCPACRRYHPQYTKLAQEMNQLAKSTAGPVFLEVDTSAPETSDLMKATDHPSSTFKIMYVPTLVSFYKGKFFSKFGGDNRTDQQVKDWANTIGRANVTFMPN